MFISQLSLMNSMSIEFKKILPEKEPQALTLLALANLPTNDIGNHVVLFSLETNGEIIATAGLERYGKVGLLRSVGVLDSQKGNGYGILITQHVETHAKNSGIEELYLLTLTAKDFFERKCHYEVVERANVVSEILNSPQFVSTCPSSAVVMKKVLA